MPVTANRETSANKTLSAMMPIYNTDVRIFQSAPVWTTISQTHFCRGITGTWAV
jgi:hypothetical protein